MALDRKLAPRRRLEAVRVPGRNALGFQWFRAGVMAGSPEKWRFGPFIKAPFSANFGRAHDDFRRAISAGLGVPSANLRQSGAEPENCARVERAQRETGLARSRRPATHRGSAAPLHAGQVATRCRKTANDCHSLPFSASYPERPFESFLSSPLAGMPASLGPGLRTVSRGHTQRTLGGRCRRRVPFHHVRRSSRESEEVNTGHSNLRPAEREGNSVANSPRWR
jgi:hypothetical protein